MDVPLRHGQTDASGNLITVNGRNRLVYLPEFRLGYRLPGDPSLPVRGAPSGFIFPHRSTIWDAEATLDYRFGKFEVQGGLKTFHFKTSPEQNEFVQATFPGIFVGLRWYPEYSSQ